MLRARELDGFDSSHALACIDVTPLLTSLVIHLALRIVAAILSVIVLVFETVSLCSPD